MAVVLSNQEDSLVVFSDPTLKIQLHWEAKGDPSGDDIRTVPDDLFEKSIAINDVIRKGILKVEAASPELQERLDLQVQAYHDNRAAREAAATGSLERQTRAREQVGVACIGPGTRAGGECGEPVAMRVSELRERPPLCNRHKGLAHQYVVTVLEPDPKEAKTERVKWSFVPMDPPHRQASETSPAPVPVQT